MSAAEAQELTGSITDIVARDIERICLPGTPAVLDAISYRLVLVPAETRDFRSGNGNGSYEFRNGKIVAPIVRADYHWLDVETRKIYYGWHTTDKDGNITYRSRDIEPEPPSKIYLLAAAVPPEKPSFGFPVQEDFPGISPRKVCSLGTVYDVHIASPYFSDPFKKAPLAPEADANSR